jgi:hypothetical protein
MKAEQLGTRLAAELEKLMGNQMNVILLLIRVC